MAGNQMRNKYYDAIRGLAVILVVAGHAIQSTYAEFDSNIAFRVIYSFHMPLFMFISGMVSYKDVGVNAGWLKRRFCQLVIPFITWFFLSVFSTTWTFEEMWVKICNIVRRPDYGLWFLWVLFLNCCLLFVGEKCCEKIKIKKDWVVYGSIIIVINLFSRFVTEWFGLGLCSYYCVYYLAGYLCEKNKNTKFMVRMKTNGVAAGISFLFIILVPMFHRVELALPLKQLEGIWPDRILINLNLVFKYVIACLGIGFSFFMIRCMKGKILSYMGLLGRNSMEVYVLHGLLYMPTGNFPYKGILVICKSAAGLFISLLLAYIINNGYLQYFIFGKRNVSSYEKDKG